MHRTGCCPVHSGYQGQQVVAHRVDGLGHQLAKPESYQPGSRWVTPLRVCPRLSSVITRLLSEGELLRVYWKNKNVQVASFCSGFSFAFLVG